MKGKIALIALALGLLMLFAAAAPAMACPTERGTYARWEIAIHTSPGTEVVTDGVLHVQGETGSITAFGAPWGPETIVVTNQNYELDLTTYTGHGSYTFVGTFATGTVEGIAFFSFSGLGAYTYNGPDISAYGHTATTGSTYPGVLTSDVTLDHGTSGALKGLNEITCDKGVAPNDIYLIFGGTTAYGFT